MSRTKSQKVFSAVVAVLMLVMSFNFGIYNVKAQEAQEYELYPIPHKVEYINGQFNLTGEINVVYGQGIDDDTKARLNEVVALKQGVSLSETTSVNQGKANILVGINGKNDVVNQHFKKNYQVKTADLYTKLDSYVLSIKDNTIMVVGKDTDSAFYGLTTLYHIVKQLKDNSIRNLAVEDFADVASRGFIEGYYGNPWSTEDRVKLMEWGGYYKLNSYFYAPKDDPKHNREWRQKYTEQEINEKIKPLADAGNKSKCRFVYALHPYMNSPIRYDSDKNYQDDLKVMQAKFDQVIKAGVRQIAILADDANNVGGQNYVKTLNDMTKWLEEKQKTYPDLKLLLPFCTQEYMYNGEDYYKQFPENVQIVMTGGKIWGEVSQQFTDNFTKKVNRGPYLWINWPCSDNSKKHLIMGGFKDFLHVNVNPANIQGIVLNPMQQSEPSKVAIFGNACYSWNIWDSEEQADTAWNNSFKYVDNNGNIETDGSNALKELSKHMINQNMDGRVRVLEESLELKKKLTPFKEALAKSTVTNEMIDDLTNEFTVLENASKTYRASAGNDRLSKQIVPWLNCWDNTTSAVKHYLSALKSYLANKDNDVIWNDYAVGKAEFDKSKTHGFKYVNGTEYAEVGVQHIVPFINTLQSYLEEVVTGFVNPEKQVIKPITSRNDAPASSINNMIDGDDSTYTQWQVPNSSSVGEYMGVTYSQPITVKEVKFLVSDNSTGKVNGFASSKLEYTTDGKTWKDIQGAKSDTPVYELGAKGLNLEGVKGLRITCTKNTSDIWPAVREIYVNDKPVNYDPNKYQHRVIKTDRYKPYNNKGDALVIDGKDNTYAWYNTGDGDNSRVNDFIGIDLGRVMPIDKVRFIMGADGDYWDSYDLEYSKDGSKYVKIESYTQNEAKKTVEKKLENIEARYVRLRNTKDKHTWLKVSEITVTPIRDDGVVDTNNEALKEIKLKADFDTVSITPTKKITLNPQQYIGIALNRIRDLTAINKELVGGENLTLEISKNYEEWQTINAKANDFPDARYARLINKTDKAITFDLNKFEVKSFEISGPFLKESTIKINGSWGVGEDSRNNGAAFDGDVNTTTEFADLPQKGQYIIYDLGQERTIQKIELFAQDQALNYIRDAEILVSNDLQQWTKVVTIGDGIENKGDQDVKCIDAKTQDNKPVYKSSSKYPNKVYVEGSVAPTKAKYLKINITATNNGRAVLFNEIFINDGEYVQQSNDPSFETSAIEVQGMVPQNMIDGNLNTAYRANTKDAGFVKYTLSEKLGISKVNIIQNGDASNAKVSFLVENAKKEKEWVEMTRLTKSLNEIYLPFWDKVYEVKIEWEANKVPTIAEIVFINDKQYGADHKELSDYIKSLNIDENAYTQTSYTAFKTVYDNAVKVNENAQSAPKDLNKAKEDLKLAVSKLVKRGDIKLVQKELDEIAKLNKDDYTANSWANLEKAVAKANELIKNPAEVSSAQVDAMVLELQKAKSSLAPVGVSKDILVKYIEDNKLDDIDVSLYMSETGKAFKEALDNAHKVIDNNQATQEQVQDAYTKLQVAFEGLQLKATDEQVNKLKELVNSFEKDSYTKTSWEKFEVVVDEVNNALAQELSSEKAEELTATLIKASEALVKKGDTTSLNDLLKVIDSLDKSKYTKDSYDNLMKVVKEVKENLKDSENLSQSDVDKLTQKLDNAYKALKETDKPVNPDVKPDNKPDGNNNSGNNSNNNGNNNNSNSNSNSNNNTSNNNNGVNSDVPQTSDNGLNMLFVFAGLLSLVTLYAVSKKRKSLTK